ncbi:MAG TPA: T9SS type A sorting domain-containing protein [Flavobacteriales bacterium]|nr:T9SS type A sorting domain-containing protein [Flavobacteriales bacterium]
MIQLSLSRFLVIISFLFGISLNTYSQPTISLISAANTEAQSFCFGISLTTISYQIGGTGTNATVSGLPNGITSSYNSGTKILTISGTSIVSSVSPYTYTVSVTGGGTVTRQGSILVKPIPTVNTLPDQVLCSGQQSSAINFSGSPSGTTFSEWTITNSNIGLLPTGTGNIAPFTSQNFTTAAASGSIYITPIANGCFGVSTLVTTITVKPVPVVLSVSPQTLCEGANTQAINFTSPLSGTAFSWTNSNTSIGLAGSGNGNSIAAFVSQNPTNADITAQINVVPSLNGCSGASTSVTSIVVHPTPIVTTVSDQSVCNGGTVSAIAFSGPVLNTFFSNWTNSNTQIGLAASGNGTINSFSASNFTAQTTQAQIRVTPSANGCSGALTLVTTISVRPSPVVDPIEDILVCSGDLVSVPPFSSNPSGGFFTWQNSNTTIGLGQTGQNSITGFTAINNLSSLISANISVAAAESASCFAGTPVIFTINVKPAPSMTINPLDNSVCSDIQIQNIGISSTTGNAEFHWVNNNPELLSLPETGIAPPFPPFSGHNAGIAPLSGTVTITPVADGCSGLAQSLTIHILPVPELTNLATINVCNGQSVSPNTLVSSIPAQLSWTNSSSSNGLPTSGSGFTIPGFTAINASDSIQNSSLSLQLVGQNGCLGNYSQTITVLPDGAEPNAQFNFSVEGENYVFALIDSNGITSTSWDFGDDITGTGNSVSHLFLENQEYTVTCIVSNACEVKDTVSILVNVDVGIESINFSDTQIFPNPFHDFVSIQSPLKNTIENTEIILVDVSGRVVYSASNISTESIRLIDLSFLKAGLYFLRLKSEQGIISKQLVKF